jgi:hypothetical protein
MQKWLPSTKSISMSTFRYSFSSSVSDSTTTPSCTGCVHAEHGRPLTVTVHTRQLPHGSSSGLWHRRGM